MFRFDMDNMMSSVQTSFYKARQVRRPEPVGSMEVPLTVLMVKRKVKQKVEITTQIGKNHNPIQNIDGKRRGFGFYLQTEISRV